MDLDLDKFLKERERKGRMAEWLSKLTGICVFIGVICIGFFGGNSSRERSEQLEERVGPLVIGGTQAEVLDRAGKPDAECKDVKWQPKELRAGLVTRSYWIYRSNPDRGDAKPCIIQYEDTVVGFSETGEIQWFNRSWGESALQVGERAGSDLEASEN